MLPGDCCLEWRVCMIDRWREEGRGEAKMLDLVSLQVCLCVCLFGGCCWLLLPPLCVCGVTL